MKKITFFSLLLGVVLLSSVIEVEAAGGDLDPTFNTGGTDSHVATITVQPDGKIIIGGAFIAYQDAVIRGGVVRVNPDASVDTTFNTGTGAQGGIVTATALQSNGKVIVCGSFNSYNGTPVNQIIRLNSDGTLDPTFNQGTGVSNLAAVVIQPDGKIVIGGGFTNYNGVPRRDIARINSDGSLDTTFNPGTGTDGNVQAILIQPDGKMIIGGIFSNYNGAPVNRIARLNSDGTLDATFNTGTGVGGFVEGMALQPDGKIIIVGGFGNYNGVTRPGVARINTDGSLDTTFDPGFGAQSGILKVVIQADGKILIGGNFTVYNGTILNRIARINPDGSRDASFNPGTGANATVRAIALQADGKILIGGSFITYNGATSNHLARLLAGDSASPAAVSFGSAAYTAAESAGNVAVVVSRTDTTTAASVNYATSDTSGLTACNQVTGVASSRCDYATTVGTLRFAVGESAKTVFIPLVDDGYVEGSESFTVRLSNPSGMILGINPTATITITENDSAASNPIVGVPFFVRQQYIDFLGREPDPGGYSAWQKILNDCAPGDTSCDRIAVSSGFFRSPEFQDRGSFIFRFYVAALGRNPSYAEFMPDLAKVSGFLSDAQLEANKVAFVNEFMARSDFFSRYGALGNAAFVDTLIQTAGLSGHPLRDAWVGLLNGGSATRAEVLRAFTESKEVYDRFYNQAFVVMQYFGYLRRDPDGSYTTWINIMNQTGDFRGMISGFMNSNEYVLRFGP